jgi:hypothetical protein
MPVNPTPARQGTPHAQARAVLQGFEAIHPGTLQKRIFPSGAKLRKIKALGDDHG